MIAAGSSTAVARPSKGERTASPSAGGEQTEHGEEAGPQDLVCARSSGGGRDGGDLIGLHDERDALMLSESVRKGSNGLKKERLRCRRFFNRMIRFIIPKT